MTNKEKMEALVANLAEAFPQFSLSFGYIGNLDHRWGDDRSWRVFTNRRESGGHYGRSVSFHLGSTEGLEQACRLSMRMNLVTFVATLHNAERAY